MRKAFLSLLALIAVFGVVTACNRTTIHENHHRH